MKKSVGVMVFILVFLLLSSKAVLASQSGYVVQKGDTLWQIASKYGISVEELKELNNLPSDIIYPGRTLILNNSISAKLPTDDINNEKAEEEQPSSPIMYTVKAGDTLWKIAGQYHLTVSELKQMNKLTSDSLKIGDILIIANRENNAQRDEDLQPSRAGMTLDGSRVIEKAAQYLGTPYRYGGTSPQGFDCSGFVQYVYKEMGYELSRTASAQYQHGTAVTKDNLMPGDLVFFACNSGGIDHVGIYSGNGQFIHSSSPRSGGVIYTSLSENYYAKRYVGAKRILR